MSGKSGTPPSIDPLSPMHSRTPESSPPVRPQLEISPNGRINGNNKQEEFKPFFPKRRSRHTFSPEELAEIEARPPEAYLAKPPRVKAWNMKKAKEITLAGMKVHKEQLEKLGDEVSISFVSPKGPRISTHMSMELTANEIKSKMFEIAGCPDLKIEDYELRIPVINLLISLDNLALRRQTFIQACILSRISPIFEILPKTGSTPPVDEKDLKKHIQTELEIFELVGPLSLGRTLDSNKPEVIGTRRSLAALRLEVFRSHFAFHDAELRQFVYVESEPMPLVIPANVIVFVQLPINAIRTTVSCEPSLTVDEARNKIFKKFSRIDIVNSQGKSPSDYVLKVTGLREYLLPNLDIGNRHQLPNKHGGFKLLDYDYVRKCISKNQQIELTLVDSDDLHNQIVQEEEESLVDHILRSEYDNDQTQMSLVSSGKKSGNHNETADDAPFPTLFTTRPMPITKMHRTFRVKACCVRDAKAAREDVYAKFEKVEPSIFVKMELFHGGQSLAPPMLTPLAPANDAVFVYPQWDEWREFPIKMSDLPKAARLVFTVYATESDVGWIPTADIKGIILGWGIIQVVDYDGTVRMGLHSRKLWEEGPVDPLGSCVDNVKKSSATLVVEFETFVRPLVYPDPLLPSSTNLPVAPLLSSSPLSSHKSIAPIPDSPDNSPPSSPILSHRMDLAALRKSSLTLSGSQLGFAPFRKIETSEARQLQTVLAYDPLTPLSPSDKKMLWNFRNMCRPKYRALAKLLQSVAWNDTEQVAEMHRLLDVWAIPPPVQALQLLDSKYADEYVRSYAVAILGYMTDAEVSDYLPQLIQALKYEPHHDSALSRFLVERALRSRSRIGHSFFWHLRSEMQVVETEERYGILLEGYLRSCGCHRSELIKQNQILKDLYAVAMAVKNAAVPERKRILLEMLIKVKFPERFQLPLDPRWEVKGLILDKCRFMDSKKVPLWLAFENVEPNLQPVNVIFKVGDDIRQDILTLQMIKIMDKLWKNASMDLRLQPYACVSMGESIGMIEVVLNAKTIASINKDAGGTGAVLEDKTLANWLRKHNPTDALYNAAVKTFILSCAGYVVATYVLGVGDRHADNIMITRSGHLFHIDFGHFLGNFKSKFGIKRERAPFIFTSQYLAIVGGKDSENFRYFVEVCCKAYNIIRKHADMFMNLFQLMVSTGIPELQSIDDINYLRRVLAPELNDDDAASEFSKNILVALNTRTVIINDIIHGWVH